VKRPLLTKQHAIKQLDWARAHRGWTVGDWRKVIWSDECAITKDISNPDSVWVSRHQTKKEKYAIQNIQVKSRDGGICQMIWGCFLSDKLGPIAFINGSVNQDVYRDFLNDLLLPNIDALRADGIDLSSWIGRQIHLI